MVLGTIVLWHIFTSKPAYLYSQVHLCSLDSHIAYHILPLLVCMRDLHTSTPMDHILHANKHYMQILFSSFVINVSKQSKIICCKSTNKMFVSQKICKIYGSCILLTCQRDFYTF